LLSDNNPSTERDSDALFYRITLSLDVFYAERIRILTNFSEFAFSLQLQDRTVFMPTGIKSSLSNWIYLIFYPTLFNQITFFYPGSDCFYIYDQMTFVNGQWHAILGKIDKWIKTFPEFGSGCILKYFLLENIFK
jgi:hypothetical protein